ncbi:MAG: methyltransferase domain-containing protein [Zoogloeaceae bacterium]|jgi:ubiquinone/menaquinone biosynthesis C-methylase UbiE|nr:methyltransferase domain-containing protein [Zoogloeaceae bacterium]
MKGFRAKPQIDAGHYRKNLNLITFTNCSYQIRDCLSLAGEEASRVMIIGVGNGVEAAVLRHLGMEVVTMDIDPHLNPEVIASAADLPFKDKSFDVVIASHVLEHLPFACFDGCLREIARIGRHALIYLPFACLVPELRLSIRPLFSKSLRLCIPLFWKDYRFDGFHYWEIGVRKYSLARIRREIEKKFTIREAYHNQDWRYSYNFVLTAIS